MPAPHRQALTLTLFEIASSYDRPARVTGKHPPARFHLVVEVREACETCETAEDLDDRLEPPGVDVLAIAGNVPPTREHQPCPRLRVVEDRLARSRRVAVDPARDEHYEHRIAARDRALDDLAVVGCATHDGDVSLERVKLGDTFLPAHANHFVPAIQRVLNHVLPELPRR